MNIIEIESSKKVTIELTLDLDKSFNRIEPLIDVISKFVCAIFS